MPECSRRALLRSGAGAVAGGAALTAASTASAAPSFGGWLDNTSNYDGVVDRTGQSEVTIDVGVKANNGNFGFGPPAVKVDPGTKVIWKWVAGSHNVVAKDGSFESKLTGETGFTFSQTFDSTGVVKYYCMPHKMMGMKGVVVVGDAAGGAGGNEGASSGDSGMSADDWTAVGFGLVLVGGLLSPLGYAALVDDDDGPKT